MKKINSRFVIGLAVGIAIGTALHNIAIGTAIGAGLGLAFSGSQQCSKKDTTLPKA